MGGKKQKRAKEIKDSIRKQIAQHVRNAFPDCSAVFIGKQGSLAPRVRTFGFRVRDQFGKFRSNIIWVDPEYDGEINEAWVRTAVSQSNK